MAGVLATLLATGAWPTLDSSSGATAQGALARERAPELGPDHTRIGRIRLTVETGTANGAGTDRAVLVWLDRQRHALGSPHEGAFSPGATATAILTGPGLPRTLGELRRASIVLALDLGRASIGASWHCRRARIEVRLEGSEEWLEYLTSQEVGWLSQDEPPRRSSAYALQ